MGELDTVVAARPVRRRRLFRHDRRLPVLLFERAGGAVQLIEYYGRRLIGPSRGKKARLVPHVMIDDADVAGREPRAALIEHVASTLQDRMPTGAGPLKLPRYRTCQAILAFDATPGEDRGILFRGLRDALYAALCRRRPWIPTLRDVVSGGNVNQGWLQWSVQNVTGPVIRWMYGVWLRMWGLRWTGGQLQVPGHDHLGTALDVAKNGRARDRDAELPARMLLAALVHDLRRAARPRLVWWRRPRRRWAFVLLLRGVGDAGTPVRRFLDLYADLALTNVSGPLLVLGALTGDLPSYAVRLPGGPTADLADQVRDLYRRAPDDLTPEGVYVAPLPGEDDDGIARQVLERRGAVPARHARKRDYFALPALVVLALALPAWAGLHFSGLFSTPSCVMVNGEPIGIIDDESCLRGLTGPSADELRALWRLVDTQNAEIDDKPHRTVVFLAPLSLRQGSGKSKPNGFATLKGAVTAQATVNSDVGQEGAHRMRLRLLIANTGEFFRHGADVTRQVIEQADEHGLAAVIGLTQSRPESLDAAKALSDAEIPVVGIGVVGSKMSDNDAPARYFQVTPPNGRIADVMAAFAAKSPDLRALTRPDPRGGGRTAIVLYDPDDTFFSADLKEKFQKRYHAGRVELVEYREAVKVGARTSDIAKRVCEQARRYDGFVVYAARSAAMTDLFDNMQIENQCLRGTPVPVLSESTSTRVLEDYETMDRYSVVRLFFTLFNEPVPSVTGQGNHSKFVQEHQNVFRTMPHPEAAGGYDAFSVVSKAVSDAVSMDSNGRFGPNEVYAQLAAPGVIDKFGGATGALTLDRGHKYPPDKAVYIAEILPGGRPMVRLACGPLADGVTRTTWGTPPAVFPCPIGE
ncbi:hypothetical protein ABGB17_35900 [Sphaerisporangium sp. B11E5]|uniref:hypothetical protein n=1 Tax=Sphaerisporangium sp. B11E5 TaxID=3153563 RepID=UPI00325E297D